MLFAPHVLREYALIADGERGALIGPHGDMVWLCVPRWDSAPVFASLIGGGGGYAVTPEARFVWGGCYEPGSLIWRSRWVTDEGAVECREALAFPGDPHRAVVMRQILARDGPARVTAVLDPSGQEFSAGTLRDLRQDEGGSWTGRLGHLYLRWSGAPRARPDRPHGAPRLAAAIPVRKGVPHDLILELSDRPLAGPPPGPAELWRTTAANWAASVPDLDGVRAARDARHACAVLRGLTTAGGGMVAAATTSLPERAEGERNYDYRYVWIRDQCYAGQAAAAAGAYPLLDAAVAFVSQRARADGPALAPAYTVAGEPVPPSRRLDLPGYPGGFGQAGNNAGQQFQLDAFGEALLLFAAAARHGRLGAEGWQAAEAAASAIERRWREDDNGIWETDRQPWTHSRLSCAAGLRAMAALEGPARSTARWSALADTITADTAAHAVHPSGHWQRSRRDQGLDGALLLPPVRGAIPAGDPRTLATLRAYTGTLTEDGYAYRFRHGNRRLGEAEGAFLFCGFVLALAAHQQGDEVAATQWFERNRAACGPPGLYSEEYDVAQRQLRGNLPQAFVHALMLECAVRLAGGRSQ